MVAVESGLKNILSESHQLYPLFSKILGVVIALMIFISLVAYGVSVYFENQVISIGKQTRSLQEDNQDLQIHLDRIRSYEKVANASSKIHGLQVATEVINITEPANKAYTLPVPPEDRIPDDIYGY